MLMERYYCTLPLNDKSVKRTTYGTNFMVATWNMNTPSWTARDRLILPEREEKERYASATPMGGRLFWRETLEPFISSMRPFLDGAWPMLRTP